MVMGGAPSLPDDIAQIRGDAIWISANQHGAMLRPVDYVLYVDELHMVTGERMSKKMAAFGAPTISLGFDSDYRVPNYAAVGFRGNCGLQAIRLAAALGANPIIVCGIECYQGGTYWHDSGAESTSRGRSVGFFDKHIRHLVELTRGANIRAVTQTMQRHFPAYDPEETFAPSEAVRMDPEPVREVMFHRSRSVGKRLFFKGDIATLTETEASVLER